MRIAKNFPRNTTRTFVSDPVTAVFRGTIQKKNSTHDSSSVTLNSSLLKLLCPVRCYVTCYAVFNIKINHL